MEKILLRNIDRPDSQEIQVYESSGGYSALRKALKIDPQDIINEIGRSRLVGRGGAAFPVVRKWAAVRQEAAAPKYVVCNADEGEPGTFKDRIILRKDPHLLLESLIIAGYAVGAQQGYIYIRGEYLPEIESIEKAILQAQEKGYLGDNILESGFSFKIEVYKGAGAYVCGEETSLIESMAGMRPAPTARPPFPAQVGFLGKPTAVNNVETLANIPAIINNGASWYMQIGSPNSPGTKLFSLSGHIRNPGVYEAPLGIRLRDLIEEYGGGIRGEFKAVLPGGISSSLITNLEINLDYTSVSQAGSTLGPASVIVINQDLSLIDVSVNAVQFFSRESCGKCSVCREGTRNSLEMLKRFLRGEARTEDIDLIIELSQVMRDTACCVLGQVALNVPVSAIRLFRREFESGVGS